MVPWISYKAKTEVVAQNLLGDVSLSDCLFWADMGVKSNLLEGAVSACVSQPAVDLSEMILGVVPPGYEIPWACVAKLSPN